MNTAAAARVDVAFPCKATPCHATTVCARAGRLGVVALAGRRSAGRGAPVKLVHGSGEPALLSAANCSSLH